MVNQHPRETVEERRPCEATPARKPWQRPVCINSKIDETESNIQIGPEIVVLIS